MHSQEIILFDLDPKVKVVKVTQNDAQYSRHHVTYLHHMVKKMHLQENTLFDLDLGVKDGHTKCCPVPLTSCDLCTSKV